MGNSHFCFVSFLTKAKGREGHDKEEQVRKAISFSPSIATH
jgi:hypothetical protein